MDIARTLAEVPAELVAGGSVVAVGKFDGIHLGHQHILARLTEVSRERGLSSVVLTFTNHPLSVLRPERCPSPVMSSMQRLDQFAQQGIDLSVMIDFTEPFSRIPAESFVSDILADRLRAQHVILGTDFRFGHRGRGDAELLLALGEQHNFTVEVIGSVATERTGIVSSSRIRGELGVGNILAATEMLGRYPAVRGEVVRGDARGREIGFPTANLGGDVEGMVPADGVYAGWVIRHGERLPAAISVGNNPTFTPDAVSRVEAFILDFSGDLYGERLEVQFVQRVRGMERFDNIDALITEMDADVVAIRGILRS